MRATIGRSSRAIGAAAAAVALLLAGCTAGSSTPEGAAADGSSVSVAMTTPTWILPISQPGKTGGENDIFGQALYPSVFSYDLGGEDEYNLDHEHSVAESVEVSEDGLTYTTALKDLEWSDGTPISARDVEFWFNLIAANKEDWASYTEGGFPDNVESFDVIDDTTFSITTTEVYSPGWYIGNQLNSLTPMPQHAWDKTSDEGEVEDLDRDPDTAQDVFDYLVSAAEDPASYATDDLWSTVSGPWTLESFTPGGEVVLAANEKYTGADAAELSQVVFQPFTDDTSQFNLLRSGGIDYGYIPPNALDQQEIIEQNGYTVEPWDGWSITYVALNFANPESGPLFEQKYLRQAMQQLIDQESISEVVWNDAASPTCGPVPQEPGAAGTSEGCAYGFDPEAATTLLEDNGWDVVPDGASTCVNPGTGEGQCGEGIEEGRELAFTMTSQSGSTAGSRMMAEIQSQFSQAGIGLEIKEVPDSVAVSQVCEEGEECSWDMSFFGSQGSWYYPVYASGERLFATDAPVNLGSYSDETADELIDATRFSSDPEALQEYNDYLAEDLPVLWMPNPVNKVSAFSEDLTGISPQNPMLRMYPQDWTRG
ncbi:peptide ABC transporter substrate-binding protein [Brachybacterium alimentarium]|uniref:peptide ABC transporter substrate-binding protein n=1 Tax=Brachybacterium alimentarium TaxID=47845 RepID=UPI003FD0F4CF